MNFFKKKLYDIEFVDTTGLAHIKFPIQKAHDIKPMFFDEQKVKNQSIKFTQCPGMFDLYKAGYIIPAWTDIHIKANKAGTTVIVGGKRGTNGFAPAKKMDSSIIEGSMIPSDGVPLASWHVGAPWAIFVSKDISAVVQGAAFHSNFLDDLHVWPGIVDYKNFKTINFIFSARRECEVHIKAGDPLLQVIPFHNKEMSASFGPANQEERDESRMQITSASEKQYYRKNLHVRKIFNLFPNALINKDKK